MQRLFQVFTGSVFAFVGATLLLPAIASAQTTTVTTTQYYDEPTPPPPPTAKPYKGPEDRVQVGAQVGWLFGSSIEAPGGDVGLNGDWAYTGNIDVRLTPVSLLEFRYTYFPTEIEFHPFVGQSSEVTDVDVHYMQAGIQSELPLDIARPFFGLTLGASHFNPNVPVDGETYFSTMVSGGVKLVPSKRVGVRLQASLPYTWTGSDSAMFCGFGGCSYGFVGDGILQLDLSAGAYAMF